ncbi:MAG: ribonuclease PH [Candidatus Promineifilaceae bacterium]
MARINGRRADQLRPIEFETNFTKWAEGSVLARYGDTQVLCNVTLEERVPRWLHQSPKTHGWLSAEYAMLPRSTDQRSPREQRWPKGRTQEISRLIGRSLRMALDLEALGQRQVLIDCDVLQADGGTRTAAISGAWVALNIALDRLIQRGKLPTQVVKYQIAAVSVGLVNGKPLLDLNYEEDSNAEADMNVVMTRGGRFIEIQGTGEKKPLTRKQLNEMLSMAQQGIEELCLHQEIAVL